MYYKTKLTITILLCLFVHVLEASLLNAFLNPPPSARPGVYWYFMDGNQDRDAMVADLEAMAHVGIGTVLFLEVNIGVPRGPVDFMSETWQENFVHAVKTAERLGMKVILGTGPGWAGSGGPWITPELSMQHLVGNDVIVEGPCHFRDKLPVPDPLPANRFAGMTETHLAIRTAWYRDVAVLAYPCPKEAVATIDQPDIKTLKDVSPYSIMKNAPRHVSMPAEYAEPGDAAVLDPVAVVDLTDKFQADGRLDWQVPSGRWKVMRFVARSTGQTTRPAPTPGHGFECDKFNPDAYRAQWHNFQAKVLEKVSPGKNGKGLVQIHLDSWEMSSQNWSAGFREAFRDRCHYDPLPYYPATQGLIVGSREATERFLWDLRKTAQDLVLNNHAAVIKEIAHAHGMQYSNEPYDMNPAGDIDLGSIADIPMCEFWYHPHDAVYSCFEAVSIAHVMGKSMVAAEAFTTGQSVRFEAYPGLMKNQTDWALALGINSFIFHTFQHQPLGEGHLPGMAMGPYGVHWHRNQNWWDMLPAYHGYLARCGHLLRQGRAVADILYLTPEGAPHIFVAPVSAVVQQERFLRDKRGYSFDAVTPRLFMQHAHVEGNRIAFPGGTHYRVLVLPAQETMTTETLKKIDQLIEQGATVIGHPPRKSPSLVDYPACDTRVESLAHRIWGGFDIPEKVTCREYGKGKIYWGGALAQLDKGDDQAPLYPSYGDTVAVLKTLGLPEDFVSEVDSIRFLHKHTAQEEIYFLANRSDNVVETEACFRVQGKQPSLWHPVSLDCRPLSMYTRHGGGTRIPLRFEPYESYFIVFRETNEQIRPKQKNFKTYTEVTTLEGPWTLSFDPTRGGPETLTLHALVDWTQHENRGVKYYSGKVIYRQRFDAPVDIRPEKKFFLDLGKVYEMARVTLNGKELGVVWTAPYRIPLGALKPKRNELVIEIANSWENRLIGDQQPEDKRVRHVRWESGLLQGKSYQTGRFTFTTLNTRQLSSKDTDLRPSGLVGPVTIQTDSVGKAF